MKQIVAAFALVALVVSGGCEMGMGMIGSKNMAEALGGRASTPGAPCPKPTKA